MSDGPSSDRLYTLSPRDRTGFLGLSARQVLVVGTAVVVGVLAATRTGSATIGMWPVAAALVIAFVRVGGMPAVEAIGPGAVWVIRSARGSTRWEAPPADPTASASALPALPPPLATQRLVAVDGARYHPGAGGHHGGCRRGLDPPHLCRHRPGHRRRR